MATPKKKKSTTPANRKKPASKKGTGNRRVKKSAKKPVNQGLLSLFILFSLVLVLGFFAHLSLKPGDPPTQPPVKTPKEDPSRRTRPVPPPPPETPAPPVTTKPLATEPPAPTPHPYEAPVTGPEVKREPPVETPSGKPKVAIIIDDIGYDAAFADKLMDLGIPITLSILPGSPHSKEIAEKAHARGFEIMLHQPMEPMEYPRINPGPGVILMNMGADESIAILEKNLKSIPYISGVNNHMGSRVTASEKHMNQIFTVLKRENLFFIDSLTTSKSIGRDSARLFKLPFARRDVFLDHVEKKAFVEKQMKSLVRISEKYGSAIGIGHPHSVTLEVLKKRVPEEKKKVDFVFASKLVKVVAD